MKDVPTVRVDHLSPTQIHAYVIADTRLAEQAGWDPTLLALELQERSVQPNFNVTVTGFEMAEIDLLMQRICREKLTSTLVSCLPPAPSTSAGMRSWRHEPS